MKKIQLSDENKSVLHILTREEWERIPNDYKTNYIVDYTKKEIIDKTIKSAFLPGYGTTLFFENRHFLIVDDTKPLKKYAIWRNHEVIGYCEIDKATADKANRASNAYFYFGFDKVTSPENINSFRHPFRRSAGFESLRRIFAKWQIINIWRWYREICTLAKN